jgi:hypothetical protein
VQDALDLAELRVDVLQDRGSANQHVNADVITDRHLVDESTQVALQLGEAGPQLVPAPGQIDVGLIR